MGQIYFVRHNCELFSWTHKSWRNFKYFLQSIVIDQPTAVIMIIPESDQFQISPAYWITPHSIRIWLFTAYSNEICLYYYSLPHASTGWESVLLKLGVKMVIINIWFLRPSHNQNTSDTLGTKATVCFREGSTLEIVHVTYSWTSKLNSGLSYSKWSHDELVASLLAILSEPNTARTNFVNHQNCSFCCSIWFIWVREMSLSSDCTIFRPVLNLHKHPISFWGVFRPKIWQKCLLSTLDRCSQRVNPFTPEIKKYILPTF